MSVTALIVAAGTGERLGGSIPKQFREICGKPILRWAAEALSRHPAVKETCVVVGHGQQETAAAALAGPEIAPLIQGGAQRSDSVRAGIAAIRSDAVLIHDAARPFCPPAVIDRLLAPLEFFEGSAPALRVSDTLARGSDRLEQVVDRTAMVRVQTPQAFRVEELRKAYDAWQGSAAPTDETTVLRAAGMEVAIVEGDASLEKITTPADLRRAEEWMAGQYVPRSGFGFDVHAFDGAGPIMLGGVEIPHARGLAGHSDADVVLHAITDALLGAAALGDIGEHFPPSDPQWRGAPSDLFLRHAVKLLMEGGAIIDHIDCTIIAEEPKVGPHRSAMRERIAQIAGLGLAQVSVKATTTEGLGFSGRREGIAAQAVANIRMGLTT